MNYIKEEEHLNFFNMHFEENITVLKPYLFCLHLVGKHLLVQ